MTSTRRLTSFVAIGLVSTLAYLGLYALLRTSLPPASANALALVATAVANTAANRRLTFGIRGTDGLARDHAAGLLAFAIALTLSSAVVAGLAWLAPSASRGDEVAALLAANVVATACRFDLLRRWFGGRSVADDLPGTPAPTYATTGRSPR
ncbi:MAG: GtrA family protein [Candidatus Limnocylindrales bacterium]